MLGLSELASSSRLLILPRGLRGPLGAGGGEQRGTTGPGYSVVLVVLVRMLLGYGYTRSRMRLIAI